MELLCLHFNWLLLERHLSAGTDCVLTFKELLFLLLLLRWSRASENLFATTGCPGKICSQLLIHHLGHPQVSGMSFAASGVSSPNDLHSPALTSHAPVLAAGGDGLRYAGIGPQLAPDPPALRAGRRQETLLLDD